VKTDRLPHSLRAGGSWQRRAVLVGLGLLLFAFGQFQNAVFAGLTYMWDAMLNSMGQAESSLPQQGALSTHALPVGICYRLLYCGLSTLLLHVLLRGRSTQLAAAGYAAVLVMSLLLLLLGHRMSLPLASKHGHWLLDLVCSPLPLLLAYAVPTASNRVPRRVQQLTYKPSFAK
jgi:hypothetical protein